MPESHTHPAATRQEREIQLRSIIESAMDAIITTDRHGQVVLFNRAAEVAFGCPAERIIGHSIERLLPARFRATHQQHMQAFARTGRASKRMGIPRIVSALRADGEEFPIDASISQVQVGGEQFFTVILRDVSAKIRSERELEAAREEIRQLALASADRPRARESTDGARASRRTRAGIDGPENGCGLAAE